MNSEVGVSPSAVAAAREQQGEDRQLGRWAANHPTGCLLPGAAQVTQHGPRDGTAPASSCLALLLPAAGLLLTSMQP
jgi:hypothetical protein